MKGQVAPWVELKINSPVPFDCKFLLSTFDAASQSKSCYHSLFYFG